MNVADSELIISIMTKADFEYTEDINNADIIIFNTCSVRENAENRVIGRISNEISRKATKRELLIGVVGCMAQRLGAELKKQNKKIDFIVGVDQYQNLPEIINICNERINNFYAMKEQLNHHRAFRERISTQRVEKHHPLSFSTNQGISDLFDDDINVNTTLDGNEVYKDILPTNTNPFTAFVTIMRGCNNFCSYCIVPYTRGRERSRPVADILREIDQAGNEKRYDVTLLGQNVNSYFYATSAKVSPHLIGGIKATHCDFPDLLIKANRIDSIKRIRFITSHPKDLSDKLIETMAACDKVCEHIHLPLQSGNNQILEKMERNYTREHYLSLIEKLRKAMPNIAITTDVIAGFPGETELQFQDTLDIMKEIRFDFAYMFKYSERSGTKATTFPDQIPEEVGLDRLQLLIEQQTEITTQKYKAKIGNIEEIYVESPSKRDGKEMSGKTRDFKITVFEGDESLMGTFVNVKIVGAVGWTLKGKLI